MPPHRSPSDDQLNWRLARYAARFHETGNPLFAWLAIGASIASMRDLPEWTLNYLERAAVHFQVLARAPNPPADVPAAIAGALEFDRERGVNPFRALNDEEHDIPIVFAVADVINSIGSDAAFVLVAEQHPSHCHRNPKCSAISATTVKRLWRKYRSEFPAIKRKGQRSADD